MATVFHICFLIAIVCKKSEVLNMKQTILSVILSFSLAVMTPGAVEIAKAETVPSEKQATVSWKMALTKREVSSSPWLLRMRHLSPKRAPHPLTSTSG